MDIVTRMFWLLTGWLTMVSVTIWLIGPQRKLRWFRQRDVSKSFLNRRGFLGDYLHIGRPCAREGWMIWCGFVAVIALTMWLALGDL